MLIMRHSCFNPLSEIGKFSPSLQGYLSSEEGASSKPIVIANGLQAVLIFRTPFYTRQTPGLPAADRFHQCECVRLPCRLHCPHHLEKNFFIWILNEKPLKEYLCLAADRYKASLPNILTCPPYCCLTGCPCLTP